MPTGPDLININPLALSDTFNTWFIRTNQIIDALNPLQIYDVYAGPTGTGLSITGDGGVGGIAYFNVNVGAGIGIGSGTGLTYGNKVVIDFSDLETRGITLGTNPAVSDLFIVNDSSDTTLNSTGTPKSIPANKILPPTVDMDGNLTINAGTVTIAGDLVVSGSQTYLATSDLRVEDFQLEIAYQLAGYVGITGATANDLLPYIGATAYFAPSGTTADATNATVIGVFKDATGPVAGSTAQVKIGSVFTRGTPNDFVNGGTIVVSGLTFDVVAVDGAGDFTVPGATTDFVNDVSLDESGIVIKGSQGDKTLLWYNSDDAIQTNQNLGVLNFTGSILSQRFSYPNSHGGFGGFNFYTYGGDDFILKFTPDGADATAHYQWRVEDSEDSILALLGVSGDNTTYFMGSFHRGAAGQVFPSVSISNWAQYLNADLLDGAHGYTGATAYSIPIADQYGVISSDWINANRIVKKYTQASHGFSVGTVVRYDVGTNTYQKAYCDNAEAAEAIGIVERVESNDFWVNMQGHISGLSLSTTGTVYFLAPESASGGLITDPSTLISSDVRKAMLYSTSTTEGIVLGYPGIINTEPTDTVYLSNAIPVGSIHPYAGSINREALARQGWLLCDGKRYYSTDWPELHGTIDQSYYADGSVISPNGDAVEISFSGGDVLGFLGGTGGTGESVLIEYGTTGFDNYKFHPIAPGATSVIVSGLTTGTNSGEIPESASVRVYGRNQGISTVFLVPDLRRRVTVGASKGDSLTGSAIPQLERGDVGGVDTYPLYGQTFLTDTGPIAVTPYRSLGITGDELDNKQPFATVNYLIRANNAYDAVIITGHNHDLRYIRFDGTHDTSNGAGYDLTDADRSQFRSNAKVLRNDADDTFGGSLTVTGSMTVQGLTSAAPEGQYAVQTNSAGLFTRSIEPLSLLSMVKGRTAEGPWWGYGANDYFGPRPRVIGPNEGGNTCPGLCDNIEYARVQFGGLETSLTADFGFDHGRNHIGEVVRIHFVHSPNQNDWRTVYSMNNTGTDSATEFFGSDTVANQYGAIQAFGRNDLGQIQRLTRYGKMQRMLGTGTWFIYGLAQNQSGVGDANEVLHGSYIETVSSGDDGEVLFIRCTATANNQSFLQVVAVTGTNMSTERVVTTLHDSTQTFNYLPQMGITGNMLYWGFAVKTKEA